MARVKLQLPEKFIYSTELPVRISEINYGGHLGNDAVLSIAHEVRLNFLKSLGYTEMNIENVGLIMSDAAIVYSAESFHGDTLKAELGISDISKIGCDFIYRLTRKEDSKEIARLKTGIVFFDYKQRKVVEIPKVFLKKISI